MINYNEICFIILPTKLKNYKILTWRVSLQNCIERDASESLFSTQFELALI